MSNRRLAPDAVQPKSFAFTAANLKWANETIAKYPAAKKASAVIPLLMRAMEQNDNWLPRAAIEYVGKMLDMPDIRVYEVATFYTQFQLTPVGKKAHIQVCGTTPCKLRGADDLIHICKNRIHHDPLHLSADGDFSWEEVECAGACVNAPMVQVFADTYEDLTPETFNTLIDEFAAGKKPKPGPKNGRKGCEPEGSPVTLTDAKLYDGSMIGSWQKRLAAADAAAAEAAKAAAAAAAAAPAGPSAATAAPGPMKTDAVNGQKAATPTVPAPAKAAKDITPKAAPVSEGLATTSHGERTLVQTPKTAAKVPASKAAPVPKAAAKAPPPVVSDAFKPKNLLSAARSGKGDDLKLIWGVGPKLEKMLHGMGIFHFDQMAVWTETELDWVDSRLEGFYGRARRDKWVEQAKKLATGWRPDSSVGEKM